MAFSKDFVWGVATSSYQIEGGLPGAERGDSVWDMLCRKPGAIFEGHDGSAACDHVNRYREDVALMKELGVGAYRFSVAWPRVMPAGTGPINEDGLSFYDRLVDELLAAGIDPWVTLYHWDTPLDLYHKGAWLNRDIVDWFGDYTEAVVKCIGDRVSHWMPLNEPQVYIGLGLEQAVHAPGDKLAMKEVLQAGHHTLMAHGRACQVIRANSSKPVKLGMAPVGVCKLPIDESAVEAAKRATFEIDSPSVWTSTWWMDPIYKGHYPEDALKVFGSDAPTVKSGDMELIHQPLDYFGVNWYNAEYVDADGQTVKRPIGGATTSIRWYVTPDLLYWGPKFFQERYGLPIVVTENGMANCDWVGLDGQVHDPQRIDFLHRYLREYRRAAAEDVDLMAYFQWSFMDNFEWAEGYRERFGLVHVDFETFKRTPKDSYHWYQEVIASNGENL